MSDQAKESWNKFAEHYEKKLEKNATFCFRLLTPLLDLQSSNRILETGCGTGNGLVVLRQLHPHCSIIASDFSEAFISIARSKNLPNIEILQADNSSLPFENETFDRYIANLSLHIVPDATKMLQEAYRVLKVGGLAGFSVWGKETCTNMFKIMNDALLKAGYVEEERSHFYLNNDEELRRLVTAAGFSRVFTSYSVVGVDIKSGDDLYMMFLDMPGMLGLKGFSEKVYWDTLNFAKAAADEVISAGKCLTFEVLLVVGAK